MSKKALQPIEQREVAFYDDKITAVRLEDGTVYVPIRPICDLLGVTQQGQLQRINRDPVLSEAVIRVNVTFTQIETGRGKNRNRQMTALPLDYLNGWLFGINANRVKEAVRGPLIRYQRECYQVLADAFGRNAVTHRPDDLDIEALLDDSDPLAIAYRHGMAIVNLAREQLLLRKQFNDRMDSAESTLAETVARVDAIEAELNNPDRFVSQTQAEQLSQAVRAVGLIFSKVTGRNEYGGVYGELYRQFGVNSYKRLPAAKFGDAINWLRTWYQDLTDSDDVPF